MHSVCRCSLLLLCLFPGVLWLWHFLYSVGPHPVSSLYIYTFVVSRAFMAGAASQAGDADSSRAPGLTSGLQGSVNVHRGALLLVPQWQCISSFVFYILVWRRSFLKKGTPVTYFCPTLDPPLGGSGRKTTTLVRDHEYFMHTKFHQNPSSGSGEEVENVKVYGRRRTDGRRTVRYDNSSLEPSAQVS